MNIGFDHLWNVISVLQYNIGFIDFHSMVAFSNAIYVVNHNMLQPFPVFNPSPSWHIFLRSVDAAPLGNRTQTAIDDSK